MYKRIKTVNIEKVFGKITAVGEEENSSCAVSSVINPAFKHLETIPRKFIFN